MIDSAVFNLLDGNIPLARLEKNHNLGHIAEGIASAIWLFFRSVT